MDLYIQVLRDATAKGKSKKVKHQLPAFFKRATFHEEKKLLHNILYRKGIFFFGKAPHKESPSFPSDFHFFEPHTSSSKVQQQSALISLKKNSHCIKRVKRQKNHKNGTKLCYKKAKNFICRLKCCSIQTYYSKWLIKLTEKLPKKISGQDGQHNTSLYIQRNTLYIHNPSIPPFPTFPPPRFQATQAAAFISQKTWVKL